MPVGDPSVSSQFLIDQGFGELSIRRARIAWTCLTESITYHELFSRAVDKNSPSAGRRFLLNWFVPRALLRSQDGDGLLTSYAWSERKTRWSVPRADDMVGVLVSLGVHMLDLDLKPRTETFYGKRLGNPIANSRK